MSNIKFCFTSRFEGGKIIEADFSQLEVAGLAIVSGDKTLKQDIRDGIDMHCMNASFLHPTHSYNTIYEGWQSGISPYPTWRQEAKEPGFLMQYGGRAKLMAKKTGLSEKQCQQFIDNYYTRYRRVKEWQEEVANYVNTHPGDIAGVTPSLVPFMYGSYPSITGRRYLFKAHDHPYKAGEVNYSPTEMKNYPIQGFSTGDLVPEVLGRLVKHLTENDLLDKILLIGTVHDSIVCDVHPEWVEGAKVGLKNVMEQAPTWMWERFGINIDIPIKAEIKVADSWAGTK